MRVISHAHNELKSAESAIADVLRFNKGGCSNCVSRWPLQLLLNTDFQVAFAAVFQACDTWYWLRFRLEMVAVVDLPSAPE